MNKFFKLKERGTTVGREILAGLITFIAMIYILPVNSGILSDMGMDRDGVFVATALVSGFVTIFMGLYGNYPVALSAGMGVNAYLAYVIYIALGSWQASLIVMFLAGIIYLILTLTPLRKKLINAIPSDIKFILSAGLGSFIAFVGLKGSGLIVTSEATLVTLGDLSKPEVLLSLISILVVMALMFVDNKMVRQLAIPIGLVATVIIGVILYYAFFPDNAALPHYDTEAKWGGQGLDKVFFGIFSDGEYWVTALKNPSTYAFIFSLLFVNLVDTTATLVAVGKGAGITDENGNIKDDKKALLADAVGAAICAPIGTSTVTSFAESNVGVEVGGRTGLMAVTTGVLFLLSALIFPIFSVFNSSAVLSAALVSVGASMFFANLQAINWNDRLIGFTAFLTIIMIVLTYSISDGLGIGLIFYSIAMLVSKRGKEVSPVLYVLSGLFVVYFVLKTVVG
jgi:AGZA family xanthine/uracil permease-like MFS transporter